MAENHSDAINTSVDKSVTRSINTAFVAKAFHECRFPLVVFLAPAKSISVT